MSVKTNFGSLALGNCFSTLGGPLMYEKVSDSQCSDMGGNVIYCSPERIVFLEAVQKNASCEPATSLKLNDDGLWVHLSLGGKRVSINLDCHKIADGFCAEYRRLFDKPEPKPLWVGNDLAIALLAAEKAPKGATHCAPATSDMGPLFVRKVGEFVTDVWVAGHNWVIASHRAYGGENQPTINRHLIPLPSAGSRDSLHCAAPECLSDVVDSSLPANEPVGNVRSGVINIVSDFSAVDTLLPAGEPDWNQAPDGATHAGSKCQPGIACWFREVGEGVFDFWYQTKGVMDADGWKRLGGTSYHAPLIARPADAKAPEWNGEGLPPAGAACEYRGCDGLWRGGQYVGQFNGQMVVGCSETGAVGYLRSGEFRSVRTAEQIAASEREEFIDKALLISGRNMSLPNPNAREQAGKLYDKGCRFSGEVSE